MPLGSSFEMPWSPLGMICFCCCLLGARGIREGFCFMAAALAVSGRSLAMLYRALRLQSCRGQILRSQCQSSTVKNHDTQCQISPGIRFAPICAELVPAGGLLLAVKLRAHSMWQRLIAGQGRRWSRLRMGGEGGRNCSGMTDIGWALLSWILNSTLDQNLWPHTGPLHCPS